MKASSNAKTIIDPVCQMKVTKDDDAPSYVFQSETYHFCADACRKAFVADPEKYLKPTQKRGKGFWGRYLDRINKATGGKPPCCH